MPLTDEQLETNSSVVITETQTIPIFKIYGTEVCEGEYLSKIIYRHQIKLSLYLKVFVRHIVVFQNFKFSIFKVR